MSDRPRRLVHALTLAEAYAIACRDGLADVVFVPTKLSDHLGWLLEEVFEGERPAPHVVSQCEARWADFTAEIRARKAKS